MHKNLSINQSVQQELFMRQASSQQNQSKKIIIPKFHTPGGIVEWLKVEAHQDSEYVQALFLDEAVCSLLKYTNDEKHGECLECLLESLAEHPELFKQCWDEICQQPNMVEALGYRDGKKDGVFLRDLFILLAEHPKLFKQCWDGICQQPNVVEALGYWVGTKHGDFIKDLLESLVEQPGLFKQCWDAICQRPDLVESLGYFDNWRHGYHINELLNSLVKHPELFKQCWDDICQQPNVIESLGYRFDEKHGGFLEDLLTSLVGYPELFKQCWDAICQRPDVVEAFGYNFGDENGVNLINFLVSLVEHSDLYTTVMQLLLLSEVCFCFITQDQIDKLDDGCLKTFMSDYKKQLPESPLSQADYMRQLFIFINGYSQKSLLPESLFEHVRAMKRWIVMQPDGIRAMLLPFYYRVIGQPAPLNVLCACRVLGLFKDATDEVSSAPMQEEDADYERHVQGIAQQITKKL